MKTIPVAALILLLTLPSLASATDLSGRSRTYLLYRQDLGGDRFLPLYEYLDIQTTDIGNESVSFQFGGWYRYDLKNDPFRDRSAGDLQYAYLDLHAKQGNAFLRLGRTLVNEGVAHEQVDGGYARTDLAGGLTVAAFGGMPVETAGDSRSSDSVYGGRVSQGVTGIYTLGVSYLQEKNDGKDFRKEEGVDIWLQPVRKVALQGLSSYNALSKEWMQHHYFLVLGPFADLRLTGEVSRTYYKDYFAATTVNAFVFDKAATGIDPNETVTTMGGSADYAVTSSVTLGADFKNYDYTLAGNSAKYYGGRLAYAAAGFGAGVAVHRMDGPVDALRYDEQRLYLTKKISLMDLTVDLQRVGYKQPINTVDTAYTAVGAAGVTFTPAVRMVADVTYSKNPDFDKDVRGMLTLLYRFDTKTAPKASGTKPRK